MLMRRVLFALLLFCCSALAFFWASFATDREFRIGSVPVVSYLYFTFAVGCVAVAIVVVISRRFFELLGIDASRDKQSKTLPWLIRLLGLSAVVHIAFPITVPGFPGEHRFDIVALVTGIVLYGIVPFVLLPFVVQRRLWACWATFCCFGLLFLAIPIGTPFLIDDPNATVRYVPPKWPDGLVLYWILTGIVALLSGKELLVDYWDSKDPAAAK